MGRDRRRQPDMDNPSSRMKSGYEHRVPLSAAAMDVLALAANDTPLCFPSNVTHATKEISDNTARKLLKDLGVKAVPHGFRSSFRDWCADVGQPREIAESALAHVVGGVEGAYFRSDVIERRRDVMQAWPPTW